VERREKVEESRRETERILAQQEADVKARKAEMERRDRLGGGGMVREGWVADRGSS
jgi:hypothetical protein